MNETINSMLTRRSIRSYKTTQIAERDLNWILEAAIYAATSRNLQSWDFTVIQNNDMLKKLSKAAADTLRKMGDARSLEKANDPDFSPFYHAPTVIIVSGNDNRNARIDCANATQNMCVAANALGLGSCYLASFTQAFDDPAVAATLMKELGIPDGYKPQYAVSLGYANEKPATPERRRDVIHFVK